MKGPPITLAVIVILSLTLPAIDAGGVDGEGRPAPIPPPDPEQEAQRAADLIGAFINVGTDLPPVDPPAPNVPGPAEPGDGTGGIQPNERYGPHCIRPLEIPLGACTDPEEPPAAPEQPQPEQEVEEALAEVPDPDELQAEAERLVDGLATLLVPVHHVATGARHTALGLIDEVVSSAGFVIDHAQQYAERRTAQLGFFLGAFMDQVDALINTMLPGSGNSQITRGTSAPQADAVSAPVAPVSPVGFGLMAVGGISLLVAAFAFGRKILAVGGATLLSRIPSKDIMKSDTRAAIFSIVETDPGVSLNEIVSRLGISRNAVAYHLAVFESEKTVVSIKDGKYRRYFVNGGKYVNGAKDVVSTIKNDVTLNVIRFIMDHPGAMQKQVCEAVGTSPSATNWHINRLEKVGLVAKEKVANTVRYSPGPSFQKYDLKEFGLAPAQPVALALAA